MSKPVTSQAIVKPIVIKPTLNVAAPSRDGRKFLIGLSREELQDELEPFGVQKFRANQLWHWIYFRGAKSFGEMTTLAKSLRDELETHFTLERPEASRADKSEDGTRKWLFRFGDGQEIETVHIPEEDRGALCVSSQVGCTLSCSFCHTGTQTMVRNLGAGEIVTQLMAARDDLGEWPSPKENRQISNIVMMGMGEPLLNYENVSKALKIVMDGDGISISRRRITLSTSGVVPMMEKCGEELDVNLAVSLHAVRDELRDVLVPINRKYPIAELLDACRKYPGANNARRITFEYVMLKDVNDSLADARELVRILDGIPAKVNLIPFNPWPGISYECSTKKQIAAFAQLLNDAGLSAPIRTPRGRDILAACGQLRTESQRQRRSQIAAADETVNPSAD